jgi:hypothetical protein
VIERRGHVLSSEFFVSVDEENAARILDTLPFHAVQDVTATHRHRLEVVREEQGYRIREDGQAQAHLLDAEAVGSSVQDRINALALAEMGGHAKLHAGCATLGGRGALFVGPGRSGKTTLMTRLLHEGFAVQGDDTVVLRDGDAMAVPRRFRVRRGTLTLVPQLSDRAPAWALEGPPNGYHVVVVDPVDLGFGWRITPVPVDVVFFLVPNHGSPSRAIPCVHAHDRVRPSRRRSARPDSGDRDPRRTGRLLRAGARRAGFGRLGRERRGGQGRNAAAQPQLKRSSPWLKTGLTPSWSRSIRRSETS